MHRAFIKHEASSGPSSVDVKPGVFRPSGVSMASGMSSTAQSDMDKSEQPAGVEPASQVNGESPEDHNDEREDTQYQATSSRDFGPVNGLIGRVHHRHDLHKWFQIPQSENLLDEYHCALRKRVLLQGRMYVFEHFVCFSSSVFGYIKKKVIPFTDLAAVRKKTHFRFPNSIEVEDSQGNKEFFTSFLSRDEAYKVLMNAWNNSKNSPDQEGGTMHRRNHSTDMADGVGLGQMGSPMGSTYGSHMRHMDAGSAQISMMSNVQRTSASVNDDDDEDQEDGSEGVWSVEDRAAPPVHHGSRPMVHCVLPGTTKDVFDAVLANRANFFEDFLESQGNRRINVSNWKRHEQLGHVRDMQFTAPIKGAFGNWGVSHTQCYQSHRFCLYQGEHIVFESSQTMTDIPYGDCFTVDLRWDIKADPNSSPEQPQVLFAVFIRVPFTRKCLFKPVIESGSFKQTQEFYTHFVEQLRPELQQNIAQRSAVSYGGSQQQVPAPRDSLVRVSSQRQATAPVSKSGSQAQMNTHMEPLLETSASHGQPPISEGGVGSRLVSGFGTMLNSLLDFIMGVCQCQVTPQTRNFLGLMLLMFAVEVLMFVMLVWGNRAKTHQIEAPVAPDASYWQQRLQVLQSELGMLRGRVDLVSGELSQVMSHLAESVQCAGLGTMQPSA